MAEEEQTAGGACADPAGVSLALAGASRSEADAYLRDQRHHLHEDLKQIGLKLWELRMGVALRVATLVIGIAAAAGLGALVWDAAHSRGLIIEPYSVPPDLAARGLTGEVVASQVIDKLTAMSQRESSRAVQSYANNWGNNIKVEIPETGISIGELRNFLRDWLGHDIRIAGEVYKTDSGIAVTVRTSGGDAGATFTGAPSDLDALMQKAAEHVFEVTQPYRYANYLDRNYDPVGAQDRLTRAAAIYHRLIGGDDPLERAWAWNGLGTLENRWHDNIRLADIYYRKSIAASPDFTIGYFALANGPDGNLGHTEDSLVHTKEAYRLLHRASVPDLNPHYWNYARHFVESGLAARMGDFAAAVAPVKELVDQPDDFSTLSRTDSIRNAANSMVRGHDLVTARAWLREVGWTMDNEQVRATIALEQQNWRGFLAMEADFRKQLADSAGTPRHTFLLKGSDNFIAQVAIAHARLGDASGAQALVAPMPLDCDPCLNSRAWVAELASQRAKADGWFARAVQNTPSLPFANTEWGKALLGRGQPDAAIAQFRLANQKSPHFTDALEYWGEALMAKNQSHLALEKFAEAQKYAPNWGRLHLKWGEALYYAGKRDESRAQFARAAALDFTPSEKSELARAPHV